MRLFRALEQLNDAAGGHVRDLCTIVKTSRAAIVKTIPCKPSPALARRVLVEFLASFFRRQSVRGTRANAMRDGTSASKDDPSRGSGL
jgi:hypothetical protein